MPKSYEDEIRELLKGMDRFPGEGTRGQSRTNGARRPGSARSPFAGLRGWGSGGRLGHVDAQRVMGGALILMLFAWIMQGPWSRSYPEIYRLAGYISLASVLLFLVALFLYIRGGAFRGMRMGSGQPPRWRGQVIEFPRRGSPLTGLRNWWRRVTTRSSRRPPRGTGPYSRGRDTYQW